MITSFTEKEKEVLFADYQSMYDPSKSPQRQGLTAPDFQALMENIKDGILPSIQTRAIKSNSWLHEDFYRQAFSREFRLGIIENLEYIVGQEIHPTTASRLGEIATGSGIVVIDYSELEPSYMEGLNQALLGAGVQISEIIDLGSQAYYTGKCRTKRVKPKIPPVRLKETITDMIESGQLDDRGRDGATFHFKIPEHEADQIYLKYKQAFEKTENHPCEQSVDAEEFRRLLVEDENVIKLIYRQDGEITTVCILSDELSYFEWINPEFFRKMHPKEYADDQVIYFPIIFTEISRRGALHSKHVVNLLCEMSEHGGHEVVIAFDCNDNNRGLLNSYLSKLINKSPQLSVDINEVDVQKYKALRLAKH